jgi:O-antigen ligase
MEWSFLRRRREQIGDTNTGEAMKKYTTGPIYTIFLSNNRLILFLSVVMLCLLVGVTGGGILAYLSPLLTAALLIALIAGILMLKSTQWGLFALVGVACLLPFATLPVKIGFTPTFLDVVMGMLLFVWIARQVTNQGEDFVASPLALPILVFILLAFFSFAAGLAHSSLFPPAVRCFGEIIIAILLFFVTINCVRTQEQLEKVVLMIILAGFAEALIGIALYFLPRETSVRLLSALSIVGYPSGWEALRFIRDDPRLPMRAISTSVDPNILGGLLLLISSLTATQLFARRPIIRRAFSIPILVAMGVCLLLTFSRGSFIALGAALLLLGLIKYRALLPLLILVAILILKLPQTEHYVEHFFEGIRGEDLATKMRLGEYKDALILIGRYPLIGVGFISAPDIDIYIGVSSLYLLIAEEMGLIGLGAFLATMAFFLIHTWQALRKMSYDIKSSTSRFSRGSAASYTDGGDSNLLKLESILLGLQTGVIGGLVGGLFDHYLFSYPHMVAFFWLYIGLAVVAARLGANQGTLTSSEVTNRSSGIGRPSESDAERRESVIGS